MTTSRTVTAIAKRSEGVSWFEWSRGLSLIPSEEGYVLTALPVASAGDALPERVVIPLESGQPMPHGHVLTQKEREHAVRAILGL